MVLLRNGCINEEFKGRDRAVGIAQSINAKREHGIIFGSFLRIKCGTVPIASSRIVNGIETERGQWLKQNSFLRTLIYFWTCFRPFLVALLVECTQSFFCSGNLITSKRVLTPAHFVQDKGQRVTLDASKIILSDWPARSSNARRQWMHADWDHSSTIFDACSNPCVDHCCQVFTIYSTIVLDWRPWKSWNQWRNCCKLFWTSNEAIRQINISRSAGVAPEAWEITKTFRDKSEFGQLMIQFVLNKTIRWELFSLKESSVGVEKVRGRVQPIQVNKSLKLFDPF